MCIIYDEGKRLPHDKYMLYDRIVDTVLHKRYSDKERLDPIRERLAALALGMHTGQELGQQRSTPEATASDREIDAILQAYQQLDGATDKGVSDTVRVREDLLSQSGLLVSRGDDKASFYHLSIQEFLAGERLHLLHIRKWDELISMMIRRAASPGWRNTCSFLFGCLVAKTSRHVGVEFLQEIAKRLELPAVDPSRRGQQASVWNQAIVLGDCLQILAGREAAIPDALTRFFQTWVLQAIEQEIAVKDRHTLGVALGRLGDPRIVVDLRLPADPDEHAGYVRIPAGTYYLGDQKQAVAITEPFWLSKYPVTNSQYALFVQDDGYARQDLWSDEGWRWLKKEHVLAPALWRNPDFNGPNQPVVGVSWWEAQAFCTWAGGSLPTEQQWEAAARGPEGLVYPWGDAWERGICNSEMVIGGTSAVGIFARDKSPFGVFDMAGNVWEWCADPLGAMPRVFRGGSWDLVARVCRSAFRSGGEPAFRRDYLGFRVARGPSV
jgi:formylglycine-generating enzyme required for sulfatase activity